MRPVRGDLVEFDRLHFLRITDRREGAIASALRRGIVSWHGWRELSRDFGRNCQRRQAYFLPAWISYEGRVQTVGWITRFLVTVPIIDQTFNWQGAHDYHEH
jgi:hypothetical protein